MTKRVVYFHQSAKLAPQNNEPKRPQEKLTFQQAQAVRKDCRARFWSQVVIPVLIAEHYFWEPYDVFDDRNMIHHKYKVWLNGTKSCFEKVNEWIKKADGNMPNILSDYSTQMERQLKREMTSLYVTFCAYFESKRQDDPRFKAQLQMAYTLIHLAADLFDCYFDLYSERFGIDMRNDYLPARIAEADVNFGMLTDNIINYKKNGLSPTNNFASVKAYEAFCDKLFDEKTLDKAGLRALELNHEDEYLDMLEREKMGVEKLAERFKLLRNKK